MPATASMLNSKMLSMKPYLTLIWAVSTNER